MGKRSPADFEVALARISTWVRDNALAHHFEHGNVGDDSTRVLRTCTKCPSTFVLASVDENGSCPHCGSPAASSQYLGPPPEDLTCSFLHGVGEPCGYWSGCTKCGALVVLRDLELALADRKARLYAIEFSREVSRKTRGVMREPVEFRREMKLRDFCAELPKLRDAFVRGQAAHLDETRARVSAANDRMTQLGRSPVSVDVLFPVTPWQIDLRTLANAGVTYRDASGTFQCFECRAAWQGSELSVVVGDCVGWWGPCLACGHYLVRELTTLHHSRRDPHIDADRALLGALQEHLYGHGFTYAEIAHLMPDGAGGSESQQRRRVENRLRKRQQPRRRGVRARRTRK